MTVAPRIPLPQNAHYNPKTNEVSFTCNSGAYTLNEDEVNDETINIFSNEGTVEDFIWSREASEQNTRIPIGTF